MSDVIDIETKTRCLRDFVGMKTALTIEEHFYNLYNLYRPATKDVYLPVFWHRIFKHDAELVKRKADELRAIVANLDQNRSYFTVVHEGPVSALYEEMSRIRNLKVYSGCGFIAYKRRDSRGWWSRLKDGHDDGNNIEYIPLPLFMELPEHKSPRTKDIFASFIGDVSTHICRKRIIELFGDHPEYVVGTKMPYDRYVDILSRSEFVLSPRGTGPSSYRMFEAMRLGAIPVYISDEFYLPERNRFDWDRLCVRIHLSELDDLDAILHVIDEARRTEMRKHIALYARHCLDFASVSLFIMREQTA